MFKLAVRNTARSFQRGQGLRSFSSRVATPKNGSFKTAYIAGSALLASALVFSSQTQFSQPVVQLDTQTNDLLPQDSVAVDPSISPFPLKLNTKDTKHIGTNYTLLGHGVRSVTFLGFKVYGIGLYIADSDIKTAASVLSDSKLLSSFDTENHNLKELLSNPVASQAIVAKLLDNGVKFLVRISPVRNTDFSHLKDGLIKSILAHPLSKSSDTREKVAEGLEQLRAVFQARKGSVPKNHLLFLETVAGGKLNVVYENPDKNSVVTLGQVNEPLVGQVLFLQYLSGSKPLSEPLRKSCVDGFVGLSV